MLPRTLAACFVALLAAACSTMTSSAATAPALDGTAWTLNNLAGRTLTDNAPTVRFEAGRANGSDGCNRYTVPVTIRGSGLEFGPRGASTQMACAPEVMKQAEAFMGALAATRSYRVAGSELQLLDAAGAVIATLAAQQQALAGTSWNATSINNGRGAVVSLAKGTAVSLAFSSDGNVSGSAGCNTFSGSYRQDGNKVSFTPLMTTRKMCGEPEGVMEQEAAFVRALPTAATARIEGNRLELRTAEGAMAALFTRAAN